MNKENKILGNPEQEKQIPRLIRRAGEDGLINRVIRGERDLIRAEASDFFKQFKHCDKADRLLSKIIIENPAKDKKGLYKATQDGESFYRAYDNISAALIYPVFEDQKGVYHIIERVQEAIGFSEEGLILQSRDSPIWDITDNSLLALAYLGLGRKKDALEHIELIKANSRWHESDDYIALNQIEDDNEIITIANASYALALSALGKNKEAEKIMGYIEKTVGENIKNFPGLYVNGLYFYSTHAFDIYSSCNAMMALAKMAVNKDLDGASKLIGKIEEHIGFDEKTGLVKHSATEDGDECWIGDSAILALAYMMQEFYRTK